MKCTYTAAVVSGWHSRRFVSSFFLRRAFLSRAAPIPTGSPFCHCSQRFDHEERHLARRTVPPCTLRRDNLFAIVLGATIHRLACTAITHLPPHDVEPAARQRFVETVVIGNYSTRFSSYLLNVEALSRPRPEAVARSMISMHSATRPDELGFSCRPEWLHFLRRWRSRGRELVRESCLECFT